MPLQGGICEGIQIVPMLWDMPTLRRDESRGPRIMGAEHAQLREVRLSMRSIQECIIPTVSEAMATSVTPDYVRWQDDRSACRTP